MVRPPVQFGGLGGQDINFGRFCSFFAVIMAQIFYGLYYYYTKSIVTMMAICCTMLDKSSAPLPVRTKTVDHQGASKTRHANQ
jgi:hypothetical protein